MGITIALVGCTENLIAICIVGFMFFSMIPVTNVSLDVLMRCNISRDTQGRAWGLISFVSQIGYIIAYAVSGVLADYVFNPLLYDDGALANTVGKVVSPFLKCGKNMKQMEANCLSNSLGDEK